MYCVILLLLLLRRKQKTDTKTNNHDADSSEHFTYILVTYSNSNIMDYHNRAGSKKGGGGIATDSQFNRQRRQQIEELLSGDSNIPFTFQENEISTTVPDSSRQNPYIYKNHSGKLVCKLCNTMHMSWTSVERHLRGKKHGLNVIRRNNFVSGGGIRTSGTTGNIEDSKMALAFQREVETMRQQLKYDKGLPKVNLVSIKDPKTDNKGISVRIIYPNESQIQKDESEEKVNNDETKESVTQQEYPPFLRVVTGLELSSSKDRNKKFLVVSFPPFENVAIEIPSQSNIVGGKNLTNDKNKNEFTVYVDDLNHDCTLWDPDSHTFFVQCYFLSSEGKKY